MGTFKTYDPKDITVTVDGTLLSGFASDAKVSIEFDNEFFTTQVGIDGDDVIRSKNNNRTATATITLMQTSTSRDFLLGKLLKDEKDNSGNFAISINGGPDGESYSSEFAFIQKVPSAAWETESGTREFVIIMTQCKFS
jgi:hypothetical protein